MECTETRRLPGVDLAKIAAMAAIVIAHVAGYGLRPDPADAPNPLLYDFWNIGIRHFAAFGVDTFMIVTGFLCVRSSCRYSRLVPLWVQMFFTGQVVAAFFFLTGLAPVSASDFTSALRPVSCREWWYVSAYFVLMAIAPFMNEGLRKASRRTLATWLAVVLSVVCGLDFLTNSGFTDVMRGYSFQWILILYVLGAYVRLHAPLQAVSARRALAFAAVLAVGVPAFAVFGPLLPVPGFARLVAAVRPHLVDDCTAPTAVATAICIFAACLKLRVSGRRTQWLLKTVSAATLGIYLFHVHPVFWQRVFIPRMAESTVTSAATYPLVVLGVAALVFFGALAAELLRKALFDLAVAAYRRVRGAGQ